MIEHETRRLLRQVKVERKRMTFLAAYATLVLVVAIVILATTAAHAVVARPTPAYKSETPAIPATFPQISVPTDTHLLSRATSTTSTTTTPPAPSHRRVVDSTAYCDHGVTASGEWTSGGMVAMNNIEFGAKWRVLDGPMAGRVFRVADRIGHSSTFDVWLPTCDEARQYGRRSIEIERVG